MIAPSAPPRFADWLLSSEPKRRFRVLQTSVAILATLAGGGVMQYVAWAGAVDRVAVVAWTGVVLAGCAGFFGAIRSGWSERFADPALTVAQMVYAVTCCAAAYAIAGAMRGAVLPLAMVVLAFGMFTLSPRKVVAISVYAVAAFGAAMGLMARRDPQTFVPAVEWSHFLMIATMMPTMSVLAAQHARLRRRLKRQTQELAGALAKIQFLATRDELTGLVNRRQALELLERERQRTLRTGAAFCVALIDLDHFKQVNDSHGHATGDEALRMFAREAQKLVRATDALARWGGEEFLLLMPDSALPPAREGVDRVRRCIEAVVVAVDDARLTITLSAGVVQHRQGETVAQTIERADAALYCAKAEGRNRVVAE